MKELDFLPTEFKPDKSVSTAEGRYLIPHPLIKRYFFEVLVATKENRETVSIKLVCLVSANKGLFRNVARFATFEDAQMIRDAFWYPGEEVLQLQQINPHEIQVGNYYSHLYHEIPVQ